MTYGLIWLTGLMLLWIYPALMEEIKFALHVAWHVGLILAAGIIIFTPVYFFKTGPTARIFSSAMLVICLMALVQLFGNLEAVGNYFINEHGMAMGSLIEISIMAFGLFYNLLEEKKHRYNRLLILEQEQTETLKKLITVQDNERKRIAGDLHDNIGPLLAALKINFRRIIQSKEGDLNEMLVTKTERCISINIHDDRNGFEPKLYGKKSLGLQNVESRVLYMKAKFSLKTEQGRGTVAHMHIPL